MKYCLMVKRLEKNEDYEKELKDWEMGLRFANRDYNSRPGAEKEVLALEVIVTEEEFVAIKKAVLSVIK